MQYKQPLDITNLLDKLRVIQEEMGAQDKAAGKNKGKSGRGKKGDRFMELKSDMIGRLGVIREQMQKSVDDERDGNGDPKVRGGTKKVIHFGVPCRTAPRRADPCLASPRFY